MSTVNQCHIMTLNLSISVNEFRCRAIKQSIPTRCTLLGSRPTRVQRFTSRSSIVTPIRATKAAATFRNESAAFAIRPCSHREPRSRCHYTAWGRSTRSAAPRSCHGPMVSLWLRDWLSRIMTIIRCVRTCFSSLVEARSSSIELSVFGREASRC